MNKKYTRYECDECSSVFELHSDSENQLEPTSCPFCKEDLGEGYQIESDE